MTTAKIEKTDTSSLLITTGNGHSFMAVGAQVHVYRDHVFVRALKKDLAVENIKFMRVEFNVGDMVLDTFSTTARAQSETVLTLDTVTIYKSTANELFTVHQHHIMSVRKKL